jgi:hypothetical protein
MLELRSGAAAHRAKIKTAPICLSFVFVFVSVSVFLCEHCVSARIFFILPDPTIHRVAAPPRDSMAQRSLTRDTRDPREFSCHARNGLDVFLTAVFLIIYYAAERETASAAWPLRSLQCRACRSNLCRPV